SLQAASLINCTIANNTATSYGGGIAAFSGLPLQTAMGLTNCTIVGNRAVSNAGGGIENVNSEIVLRNSIVAGNFLGAVPSTTPSDIFYNNVDASSSYNLIGSGGSGGLMGGVNDNHVGVSARAG